MSQNFSLQFFYFIFLGKSCVMTSVSFNNNAIYQPELLELKQFWFLAGSTYISSIIVLALSSAGLHNIYNHRADVYDVYFLLTRTVY